MLKSIKAVCVGDKMCYLLNVVHQRSVRYCRILETVQVRYHFYELLLRVVETQCY